MLVFVSLQLTFLNTHMTTLIVSGIIIFAIYKLLTKSVRQRFNIAKNIVSFASKIISNTLDAGLIKVSDPDSASEKFASYVSCWS